MKFLVWPGQQSSGLNVIEYLQRTIKLKLQTETDMVRKCAQLTERSWQDLKDAAC